ncbi:hypothetical protein [uncultured Bifidobacterium sp.]|uniref:hypothetical protein n=1 Tax=uncultured Bifidobacterium sp. TaxID=165187 RepID=UPI00259AC30E|nr:hypothetical protein [uncultured Bifidobacterium sp.]
MSRGAHAAHANRSVRTVSSGRRPQQAVESVAPSDNTRLGAANNPIGSSGDPGYRRGADHAAGPRRRASAGATRTAPRLTFLNAVRAELCKALSLKSTYVLLVINAVLLPIGSALLSWAMAFVMSLDPQTGEILDTPQPVAESFMWSAVSSFVPTCLLVTGIFGVMAVTVEYSSSTIQSSLVANPRRVMFLNAKTLVVAALAFLSSLIGLLLAWGVAYPLLSPGGLTSLTDAERALPYMSVFGGALLLTAMAVLAVGLGGVCRSTMGGVFALVGVLIIAPSVLSMASLVGDRFAWLQSVARCLPDQAASNFLTAGVDVAVSSSSTNVSVDVEAMDAAAGATVAMTPDASGLFEPTWWQSGLILLAWVVAAYVIGVMVVRRSDVK